MPMFSSEISDELREAKERIAVLEKSHSELLNARFRHHVLVLDDCGKEWVLNAAFYSRGDAYEYTTYVLEGCKTKIIECEKAERSKSC